MKRYNFVYCSLLTGSLLMLSLLTAPAAVTLNGMSSFDAMTSRYTYTYSVTNSGSMEEIVQVFFPVSPAANLLGLTAPTGFAITFNDVEGVVNFRWDEDDLTMQTFAPDSTVSGFSFTSPVGPGPVTFTAQDVVQDYSGPTTAPIPEPSAALLVLLGLPLLHRRSRA